MYEEKEKGCRAIIYYPMRLDRKINASIIFGRAVDNWSKHKSALKIYPIYKKCTSSVKTI